jgi:non-homologous end joining protein Ku
MAKVKTTANPELKKWISFFTVRLDALTFFGSVIPIGKEDKNKPKFHLVTPDGKPVSRAYIDEKNNIFNEDDLIRTSVDEEGEGVLLTKEELEEARASELPKNVINLTVHDAAEVNTILYPADNGYVFMPNTDDPRNKELNDLVAAALQADPSKALLGICNLRGHEGLFRFSVWRGHLVFHKQRYPSEIKPHPIAVLDVPLAAVDAVKAGLERRVEPFDPDKFRNNTSERLRAALAKANGTPVEEGERSEESPSTGVLAALDALGW